jgi:hypothetical protein
MKTREQIITSMCYTYRHDFGLFRKEPRTALNIMEAGMTALEQRALWDQMAQIFDNDIAPNMEFRND